MERAGLTEIQLLLRRALVVNIPKERPARGALVPRAGDDHECANVRARDAVHLGVWLGLRMDSYYTAQRLRHHRITPRSRTTPLLTWSSINCLEE